MLGREMERAAFQMTGEQPSALAQRLPDRRMEPHAFQGEPMERSAFHLTGEVPSGLAQAVPARRMEPHAFQGEPMERSTFHPTGEVPSGLAQGVPARRMEPLAFQERSGHTRGPPLGHRRPPWATRGGAVDRIAPRPARRTLSPGG
jgi:hypothetical protein